MSDLDPVPLDEVFAIVAQRARRRRQLLLRGTLGAGAAAAVVVGAVAINGDPSPTAVVADGGPSPTAPAERTPTTPPTPAGPPAWQAAAVAYASGAVGFEFDDAEELAAQWEVERYTAKVVVGEAVRGGMAADVSRLASGEAGADVAAQVQAELIDAFWSAGYDIGDAAEHGARWGTEAFDAKMLIGVRVATGQSVDE